MIRIYYKTGCSKCQTALEMVSEETKEETELIEYIETRPGEKEIADLLVMLGIPAEQLVRKKEDIYIEKFSGKQLTEQDWIKILVQYPELIERPIIIYGDKAVIGRPPEKIIEFLRDKSK
jgi:arsenate reductase (glutaredoxin)